jgi:tetratricopeptide (TPR) repeat protein
MLIDDGLLRFEDGAWHSAADLAYVTVPPTIQLILAARLDRLDAEERGAIERGSVEGQVFHVGAVATLSPGILRPRVSSLLLGLARKLLIRPDRAEFAGDDAFRFRHLLIRDAAYQAMAKEQRADLHERFADWLTRAASGRMAEYEEILAHHLEQAYRYRTELGAVDDRARAVAARAAEHLASSAARADERGDLPTARSLVERWIELAEDGARARAMVAFAELLQELGEYTDAYRTALQAIEAAEAVGDRHCALRAEVVRIRNGLSIDPMRTMAAARDEAERVLAEAHGLGDQVVGDLAILAIGLQSFFLGQTAEAMRTLDRLSDRAPSMGRRERAEVAAQLVVCAHFGWVPVADAFGVLDRAADLRGDSLAGRAHDLKVRGAITGMTARFDEARAMFEEADALYDELGAPTIGVATNQVVAETLRLEGRLEEAERVLRQMYEVYSAMEETGFNSTVCALLALTLCDRQRFDEAEAFARRSRAMTAEDDFASQCAWRAAMARISAQRGRYSEAEALADEAIAIVDATDYLVWQGDCYEVRGIVLAAAGRGGDACLAYEAALDRFERKGNVVAAARIRDRLEGASGSVPPP